MIESSHLALVTIDYKPKAWPLIPLIMKTFVVAFAAAVCRASAATVPAAHPAPANVDWDSFTFSLNGVRTDSMWLDKVIVDENGDGEI